MYRNFKQLCLPQGIQAILFEFGDADVALAFSSNLHAVWFPLHVVHFFFLLRIAWSDSSLGDFAFWRPANNFAVWKQFFIIASCFFNLFLV
jgi:hypothetical protein